MWIIIWFVLFILASIIGILYADYLDEIAWKKRNRSFFGNDDGVDGVDGV